MRKAALHRLQLVLTLLPKGVPVHPPASKLTVEEVAHRLRHRVVALVRPSGKRQSELAIHQHAQTFTKLLHESRALSGHLVPSHPTARQLPIEHMSHAATHRLQLVLVLLPLSEPAHPAAGEVAIDEVAQRTRHRAHAARLRCCFLDHVHPASEGERSLAVHQHAQALTQLLHELGALNRHLDPRAEALRQLTIQHVPKAALHRVQLRPGLLPVCLPALPATGQVPVEEVFHRLHHRVVSNAEDALAPSAKGQRSLAIDHHARALTKLLHELGTVDRHLVPRAKAARQCAVQHVAQTAAHRLELRLRLRPLRVPVHPALGEVPVQEVAHRLRFRVLLGALDEVAPRHEGRAQLPIEHEARSLVHGIKSSSTLLEHAHPPAPALRLLAVEHVPHAPRHCLGRLDRRHPAAEAHRNLAVDQHAQAFAKLASELSVLGVVRRPSAPSL